MFNDRMFGSQISKVSNKATCGEEELLNRYEAQIYELLKPDEESKAQLEVGDVDMAEENE